ncbi:MAG: DUF4870 family protein [Burkholderiales bacterium]
MPRIPGFGWYALAGAVFIAGLALGGILVWSFIAGFEPAVRFLAPGAVQLSIAVPGDQIVWHEHHTLYQGRAFNVAPAMPDGTRYRVQAPDGSTITIEPHSGMRLEGSEGRSVSVAHFSAPSAGVYRVSVEGLAEPRVMAVGANRAWPIMKLVGEVSLVVVLALGAAIAVGLYGFLRTVADPRMAGPREGTQASLRQLAGLVYGLQAASMLVGVTLFAGVIINYLRREQAAGTWLESHFTWQIRTFWWSLAWCVLGIVTAVVLVGVFILIGSGVWFVYRIVRGWIELNEGRPMYV